MNLDGGHLVSEVLKLKGVDVVYTLSGGHIFSIYDGCVKRDIKLLDVRHEQTAAFAAEAHAKLTRDLGVACLTAGPGVTNAVSAITTGYFNGAPMLVLGGRAPHGRWGSGSLQELDHVPIVESITKAARTVDDLTRVPQEVVSAIVEATSPHRGPVFLDFPLDTLFARTEVTPQIRGVLGLAGLDPGRDEIPAGSGVGSSVSRSLVADKEAAGRLEGDVENASELIAEAERPVVIAGTDVWMNHAEEALRSLAEATRVPVIPNGMGRGCLPSDHELVFSRARSMALKQADLVVVVGTPMDFRLGFGSFGEAKTVHLQDSEDGISRHANPTAAVWGSLTKALEAFERGSHADRTAWVEALRAEEQTKRMGDEEDLSSEAHPIKPARIYGVLREKLDRDAVVVGDGGDFVSYAGRYVDVHTAGAWLDPGPYGCLGLGVGYAIAAKTVHPDRQVVLLTGDGAIGFSGMDLDTLVRHNLPVVVIVGNNGIWGLEKHPMKAIYGYDVAADLNQDTRYELILEAFGGAGETVEKAAELPAALDRAFEAGVPYLLNVLTDPADAYPRSSNLA